MGGKKPLRRPLWPPTRATASNYYPLGLDGAGGAAKPLLRAPKKPAPLHGRLPAFSGAVDAFERARKCFLEWRYFFSIILSEFLKNRVALHTGRACDNGTCKIYNLDFPDVIAVRDALLPAGEREKNIPCNLNDTSWFSEIDASGGAVFFAAGVFYYFLTPQVKALVCAMAEAFPGGKLVFDAANRKAVKLMLKTWLKDAEIKDVGAYFAVTDARRELSAWRDRLRVSSRGYMLGYNDLRNQNVRKFFRFLSKVGDGMMNMQIVRLDFAKENKKHE